MRAVSSEVRQLALVARHHLDGQAASFTQAVEDLVAMHSSDPITPHIGLWARVQGFQPAQLDSAMPDSVWRLHAMRRTLWVMPSSTVGFVDAAVGRAVFRKERRKLLGWVSAIRGDAEEWLERLTSAVVAEVAASPGIHTRQLHEAVPELATKITVGSGKWTSEVPVGSRLLFCLALELRVVRGVTSGTWKTSQYGWHRAPEVQRSTSDEGRLWLVQRYLERFAPVTTADIRWWTGLTAAQVKKALGALDAEVVALAQGEAWILSGMELHQAQGVCLLPGLDPTPMGYKDREWFLGGHRDVLFDKNGNIGPTMWVDGRIVGGWAVDAEGKVRTRLLEQVAAVHRGELDERAGALQEWLNGLAVTPRFRTPLERKLVD